MAQDYSATTLAPVVAKMTDMFNSSESKHFAPTVATLNAFATKQSVRFADLDALTSGCRGVDVAFFSTDCTDTATDCTSGGTPMTCTFPTGGDDTEVKNLADNLCYTSGFQVDSTFCGNAFTMDDARANGLARAIAKIETALNIGIINAVDAFPPRTPAAGTVSSIGAGLVNVYQIELASWAKADNPIGKILIAAELEDLMNPYLISGSLLYEDYITAMQNTPACCDPVGQMLTAGPADIAFDIKYLDANLGAADHNDVLAVDPSATIFWNHYDFEPIPMALGSDVTAWRVQSPRLTFANGGSQVPVWYDVTMKVSCGTTGGKLHTVEQYQVSFKGGFLESPDICVVDEGAKILHFTNDDGVV